MLYRKKQPIIMKILQVTQVLAIVWAVLNVLIYLSALFNLLLTLSPTLGDICVFILYSGLWGAPILAIITLPELLTLTLRRKSLKDINRKLTLAAVIVPPLCTAMIAAYDFGVAEILG